MASDNDKKFIRRCFKLAEKGAESASPNPLVGAVITKNGKVISEGWHKKSGEAHAELNAISNAKESLLGTTLYCNLEPCCHTDKKTLPCVPEIIKCGIKKVVLSNIDPNPKVAGKGIEQLRNAGIGVEVGVLEGEGKDLNKFFFKFITEKIPYVTLKIARSVDGKISESYGKQSWLTGKLSGQFVHSQRAVYDAVLVGSGTINIDNPQLNVRHVNGRNPLRIIIDGNLSLDLNSNCLNDNDRKNILVCVSKKVRKEKLDLLRGKSVRVLQFPSGGNGLIDLKLVLGKLAEENITSILVEGGRRIFSEFIGQNLFDELILLQAPVILGNGIDAFAVNERISLSLFSTKKLGEDVMFVYKKRTRE